MSKVSKANDQVGLGEAMKEQDKPAFPGQSVVHLVPSGWAKKYPDAAREMAKHKYFSNGMTLRQYYAAVALQGMLANSNGTKTVRVDGKDLPYVEAAFLLADCMLRHESKGAGEK